MFKILDWTNPFLNIDTSILEDYVLGIKDSLKNHREINAVTEDLDIYAYLKTSGSDPEKHHQIYFDDLHDFLNIKKCIINLIQKHDIPTNINGILIINNEMGTHIPWHSDGHEEVHNEIGAILIPLKKYETGKIFTYFHEDLKKQLCFERHMSNIVQIKTWPYRHKTGPYPDNYFYVRIPVTKEFNGF